MTPVFAAAFSSLRRLTQSPPDSARPELTLLVAGARGGMSLVLPLCSCAERLIRQDLLPAPPPRHQRIRPPLYQRAAPFRRKVRPGLQRLHLLYQIRLH